MASRRRNIKPPRKESVEELDDDDIDAIAAVRKDFSHMARSFALDARRSMGKLMTVFRKYDKSGDGNINMDELEPLMVELLNWPAGQDARLQKKLNTMRRFIERNDLNRDGQLDFIEFVGVLLLLDDKSWDSELQSRFVALDVDRDGRISHEELLRSLTPQIGREAALAYLKEFDKDDDGQISYKEFILRVLEVGLAMPGPAEEGDLLAKYRDVFQTFDVNGDNSINVKELGSLARALKLNPTDQQLRKLLKEYDVDGDGCVNFREFVILMLELQELRGTDDSDFRALWNALCVFDKDGNGFIDGVELIEVLQQVVDGGAPLSTAEVRQLIRKIDKNRDGKIDTRELAYFLIGGLEAASKPGNGGPAEKAFPART